MRPRVLIGDLRAHLGQQVRLCGWVDAAPTAAGGRFPVRDRTGWVVVVTPGAIQGLGREAAVEVEGVVRDGGDDAQGAGAVEVVGVATVVSPVAGEPPVDAGAPVEKRLDWRFLDLRRPRALLTFQVQTTAERAMRQVWADEGFIELHSPKLRPDPNPRGHELFTLWYFGRPAYLAKSPQHAKQMAMASGFERVFEIGPVFRANPHASSRHDTEFTSVDVEMSWVDSHEDIMAFEERWLRHVIASVAREHGADIKQAFGTEVVVPDLPFPRVRLDEARSLVAAAVGGRAQPAGDLDPSGERRLGEIVAREHGHEFVFVTEYPADRRAFYHMRIEPGSEHGRDFDLLWKGMEVTTGAQREHRYEQLVDQAEARGVALEPIRSYLDCFRFGCPPHGGFGLGLTRFLMALLGEADVREVTFCPRTPDRLRP